MLSTIIGAIPYTTHPEITIGGLTIHTFGLMVAIGMLLGIWFAAGHAEQYGMSRDDTYQLGTRMVVAGVIGSRITWVATHWDQIQDPIDLIAVWEGGLQFSGGFIAAILVGLPRFLSWNRLQRWQLLDGFAVAVLIGAAFGRLGCLAVGEHFGRHSDFFLATRWDGGELRENTLGDAALNPGDSFLNPSLYECVTLFVLFFALRALLARKPTPSVVGAAFLFTYGVQRFVWDSLRVNDERVAGMTGAQWMCLAMLAIGVYLVVWVRPRNAAALAAGEVGGVPVFEDSTQTTADGQQIATRKRRAGAGRPSHATAPAEAADGGESDPADAANTDPDSDSDADVDASEDEPTGSTADSDADADAAQP